MKTIFRQGWTGWGCVLAIAGSAWVVSAAVSKDRADTDAEPEPETVQPESQTPYTVHEWGTFTTVHASNGQLLPGLEQEEEHLPNFVYNHDGMSKPVPPQRNAKTMRMMKGFMRPLANVTVKMETPVLYFYSEEAMQARVSVGFDGGSISQWFPQRSGGETPPPVTNPKTLGRIDFAQPYEGEIEWEVDVLPPGDKTPYTAVPQWGFEMWPAARVSSANRVRVGEEVENFLFYRGVGNFDIPLQIVARSDDELVLQNTGPDAIPFMFVYDYRNQGLAKVWWSGALEGGEERVVTEVTGGTNPRMVQSKLVQALVQSGLNGQEAVAMVKTWQKSYFDTPGLRVFWVVPRAFTDQILPIQISPKPGALERVILDRSEVLTPGFEQLLEEQMEANKLEGFYGNRYYKAYRARVGK